MERPDNSSFHQRPETFDGLGADIAAGNALVELTGSGTVRVAAAAAWSGQFRAGYRGTGYRRECGQLLMQFGAMAIRALGRGRRSPHQRFKLLAAGIT